MIKLSKRLEYEFNEIPNDTNIICDVGCDHGKVIVKSIIENKAKTGIAIDISKDSLNKAILLSQKYNCYEKISFLNCYGLYDVSSICDYTIISGIGGNEISNILKEGYQKSKKFLICPHSDVITVRKTINLLKLNCEYETIVFDKKFYVFLHIDTNKSVVKTYNDDQIYLGKFKSIDENVTNYYENRNMQLKKFVVSNINKIDKELLKEYEVLDGILNKRCN